MPDYIFMLESRLLPDQLRVLNFLQEEAQDAQLNLYLVGGAVRDLLTGSTIRDMDFVFEGNPLRLAKHFTNPAPKSVVVNEDLKSVEIVLTDGVMLNTRQFREITDIDQESNMVTAMAHTIIGDFGEPLWEAGLWLKNQGNIDTQAIAGTVATSTHGSGPAFQSFSGSLRACRLVDGHGEVRDQKF